MIKELILPDLGEGIEGADVSEVSVSIGDKVSSNDTVLVLESDKASMEIPAENNGTVKEILVSVGDEIKTGQALLKIESSDKETEHKETKEEDLGVNKKQEALEENLSTSMPSIEKEGPFFEAETTINVFASPGVGVFQESTELISK